MPRYTTDGLASEANGLTLTSENDIINQLGTDDGSDFFRVRDSLLAACFDVNSDKSFRGYGNGRVDGDMTVIGNLVVSGEKISISSTDVNIGDNVLNLNSGVEDNSQNVPAGISIKTATVASGSVLNASQFDSGTDTITISGGPGPLSSGDVFFVKDTEENDGYYVVDTVGATSIVIETSSALPGVRTSLSDETVAAKITKGSPALIYHDSNWKLSEISDDGNNNSLDMVGIGSILAVDFTVESPNLRAKGTSTATSAAQFIGLNDSNLSLYTSAPETVQEFADQTNTILNTLSAAPGSNSKTGSQSIANSATTVVVTYGAAFSTSTNQVIFSFEHTTPGSTQLTGLLVAKTSSGFTVELSGAAPDGNYTLNWVAYGT